MSNRTFCVLLAAVVMLLGAATGALMKYAPEEAQPAEDASAMIREEEALIMPVSGEIAELFGAQYDETCGQWSLAEEMAVRAGGKSVYAPLSGRIESIDAAEGGGSRIVLIKDDVRMILYPIHGVRVFAGSSVKQGEVLGSAEECLSIKTEVGGVPVDPMSLVKSTSF